MYIQEGDFVRITSNGYPHPFNQDSIVEVKGYNNPLYVKDSELRVEDAIYYRTEWIKEEDCELITLDYKIEILEKAVKEWEEDLYEITDVGFCYYFGRKYNAGISRMMLKSLEKDLKHINKSSPEWQTKDNDFWFGEREYVLEASLFRSKLKQNKPKRIKLLKETLERLKNEMQTM